MMYSVATPDYRYNVYTAPGTFPPTGHFQKPRGKPINGLFPRSQYLPVLPFDAVLVGEAVEEPVGVLAVLPNGLMHGVPEPVKRWGVTAALVGLGWWLRTLWSRK
jgi:hypothetical protein